MVNSPSVESSICPSLLTLMSHSPSEMVCPAVSVLGVGWVVVAELGEGVGVDGVGRDGVGVGGMGSSSASLHNETQQGIQSLCPILQTSMFGERKERL